MLLPLHPSHPHPLPADMQTDGHQLNGHPHRPCGREREEMREEGGRESMNVAYRMALHSYDTSNDY